MLSCLNEENYYYYYFYYYYYYYYYYNGETSALGSCLEILLFEVGIRARIGDQGRIQGVGEQGAPLRLKKI